jgi:hypothetical protein
MRAQIQKARERALINMDRVNNGLRPISLGEWATIDEQETGQKIENTGYHSIDSRVRKISLEDPIDEESKPETDGGEKATVGEDPGKKVVNKYPQKRRIQKGKKMARAEMELGHKRKLELSAYRHHQAN